MAKLEFARYTILFATAVCVVCALMVSVGRCRCSRGRRPTRALHGEERPRGAGLWKPGRT